MYIPWKFKLLLEYSFNERSKSTQINFFSFFSQINIISNKTINCYFQKWGHEKMIYIAKNLILGEYKNNIATVNLLILEHLIRKKTRKDFIIISVGLA